MKGFLIAIFVASMSWVNGQSIREAKVTSWANGVCCVSGSNYEVLMELDSKSDFQLDKIWLQSMDEPIYGQMVRVNESLVRITFKIYSDETRINISDEENIQSLPLQTKPEFKGEALIVLVNPIKEILFGVEKFTHMPPLAYP